MILPIYWIDKPFYQIPYLRDMQLYYNVFRLNGKNLSAHDTWPAFDEQERVNRIDKAFRTLSEIEFRKVLLEIGSIYYKGPEILSDLKSCWRKSWSVYIRLICWTNVFCWCIKKLKCVLKSVTNWRKSWKPISKLLMWQLDSQNKSFRMEFWNAAT